MNIRRNCNDTILRLCQTERQKNVIIAIFQSEWKREKWNYVIMMLHLPVGISAPCYQTLRWNLAKTQRNSDKMLITSGASRQTLSGAQENPWNHSTCSLITNLMELYLRCWKNFSFFWVSKLFCFEWKLTRDEMLQLGLLSLNKGNFKKS